MKYLTKSETQTIVLGKKLASQLKGGEVITLIGPLGAGKTTLIKGIAAGLGIKKIITSPTFVLMKVYKINSKVKIQNSKFRKLVHLDCYRLKQPEEILAIGVQEYFNRKDTLVVIEWADKIRKILPRQKIEIRLKFKKMNLREINIK